MGEVVEIPQSTGWITSHGFCTECLAGCVQVNPASAPERTQCHICMQMTVRIATPEEVMLMKERSNIEGVLGTPSPLRVEVYGRNETISAVLTGKMVDGIMAALLQERLSQVNAALRRSAGLLSDR